MSTVRVSSQHDEQRLEAPLLCEVTVSSPNAEEDDQNNNNTTPKQPASAAAAAAAARETTEPRRFEQLVIFVALLAVNQMAWVSHAAIPDDARRAFGVPGVAVTALALTYEVLYLPGSGLAARALRRRGGLRSAVLEAAAWLIGGAALKLVGALVATLDAAPSSSGGGAAVPKLAGYALTLVGQSCCALGQPHLVNTPASLAAAWFPVSERDLAATIAFLGTILGDALGEALSPVVFDLAHGSIGLSTTAAIAALCAVDLVPAVACGAWARARFLPDDSFAVDKQQQPPRDVVVVARRGDDDQEEEETTGGGGGSSGDSPGDRVNDDADADDWGCGLGGLVVSWRDAIRAEPRHVTQLAVVFGVGLGVFNALLSLAAQWLRPCGYDDDAVGFMTATFVVVGIPAAALVGASLDASRAYRPAIKALLTLDLVAVIGLLCAARRGAEGALYATFAALGAGIVATSAALMEAAVEVTHPAPPDVSTGLLFSAGNVLSIPVTFAFQGLLGAQHGRCRPLTAIFSRGDPFAAPVALFTLSTVVVCFAITLTYRGPYRRLEAERRAAASASATEDDDDDPRRGS